MDNREVKMKLLEELIKKMDVAEGDKLKSFVSAKGDPVDDESTKAEMNEPGEGTPYEEKEDMLDGELPMGKSALKVEATGPAAEALKAKLEELLSSGDSAGLKDKLAQLLASCK
jgi:hypothetical protein